MDSRLHKQICTQTSKDGSLVCTCVDTNLNELFSDTVSKVNIQDSALYYNKCKLCKNIFNTLEENDEHLKNYGNPAPHSCSLCTRTFKVKCTLLQHMRVHNEQLDFKCEVCKQTFGEVKFQIHKRDNPRGECTHYKCSLCSLGFRSKSHLVRHTNSHRVFGCLFCNQVFKTNNLLSTHLLQHDLLNPQKTKHKAIAQETSNLTPCKSNNGENGQQDPKPLSDSVFPVQTGNVLYEHISKDGLIDNTPFECKKCRVQFEKRSEYLQHIATICKIVCKFCDIVFETTEDKIEHLKTSNEDKFRCEKCDTSFNMKCTLYRHSRVHAMPSHTGSNVDTQDSALDISPIKTFQCKICKHQTTSEEELKVHLSTHADHRCALCEQIFETITEKDEHLKCNGDMSPHVCALCTRTFKVRCTLTQHMRVHNQQNDFKCEVCKQTFDEVNFRIHKLENPRGKCTEYTCTLCELGFSCKSQLSRHTASHRVFSCMFCNATCKTKDLLSTHIAVQHHINQPIIEQHKFSESSDLALHEHDKRENTNKKPKPLSDEALPTPTGYISYICRECGAVFRSQTALVSHVQSEHIINDSVNVSKNFECKKCHIEFVTKSEYLRHVATICEILCKFCDVIFNTTEDKIEHLKASKDDKFHCEKCDKSFKVKCTLNRHSRVHVRNGVQVKCDHCYETFTEHTLKLHKQQYSGSSCADVKCRYCRQSFKDAETLHNHIQIHVENSQQKCCFCSETFPDTISLNDHVLKHDFNEHIARTDALICFLCGKRYRTKLQMEEHVRAHSGEKPFRCDLCYKSYRTKSGFQLHNSNYHSKERLPKKRNRKQTRTHRHTIVKQGIKKQCTESNYVQGFGSNYEVEHVNPPGLIEIKPDPDSSVNNTSFGDVTLSSRVASLNVQSGTVPDYMCPVVKIERMASDVFNRNVERSHTKVENLDSDPIFDRNLSESFESNSNPNIQKWDVSGSVIKPNSETTSLNISEPFKEYTAGSACDIIPVERYLCPVIRIAPIKSECEENIHSNVDEKSQCESDKHRNYYNKDEDRELERMNVIGFIQMKVKDQPSE